MVQGQEEIRGCSTHPSWPHLGVFPQSLPTRILPADLSGCNTDSGRFMAISYRDVWATLLGSLLAYLACAVVACLWWPVVACIGLWWPVDCSLRSLQDAGTPWWRDTRWGTGRQLGTARSHRGEGSKNKTA